MSLPKIARILRAGQLYSHHAHNNCQGSTFMQDHDFFGSVYPALESDYDSVVERIIGSTGKEFDSISLSADSLKYIERLTRSPGSNNNVFFRELMKIEVALCDAVDECVKSEQYPEGTRQLIGNIADKSMVRQYKIRQRISG